MQVSTMKPLSEILPGQSFLYEGNAYHRLDVVPNVPAESIPVARLDTGTFTVLPATQAVTQVVLKVVAA
jgi:hypothetical protein